MEGRNPIGYEKQKLYFPTNTASQRVASYADMIANAGSNPMLFVVDVDEVTAGEDVLYYWSGIESKVIKPGDVTPELTALATQVSSDKADVMEAKDSVIGVAARKVDGWEVNTLAEAQSFAPTLEKASLIFVVADESQAGIRATYVWDTVSLQEILLL